MAYRGQGAFLGIGIESSAWNTEAARTNFLRVSSGSMGLSRDLDFRGRGELGVSGEVANAERSHFTSMDNAGGSVNVNCCYDDSTVLLLACAMGAVADAGAGPYTHTMTLATVSALDTLTIEQALGTGSAEVFTGCVLTGFELSCKPGEQMKLTLPGIIAGTSGGLEAQSTPTFSPGDTAILANHASAFNFNFVNYTPDDWSIKVERPHDKRNQLGSLITAEPLPGTRVKVTGRVTIEYATDALHTAWLAGTQGDATLTFTGSGNNVAAFTMHNLYLTKVSIPIQSQGVIRQTVEFTCEGDGTDAGLGIVITNDNATYTVN